MKHIVPSLRLLLVLSALLGLIYPAAVTWIAQFTMPEQAAGHLVSKDGRTPVGSKWIAQKFNRDIYFWPRPSAVDFQTMPSGASNLSPDSKILRDQVRARSLQLLKSNPSQVLVPADLLFTSGSGLDPEISPAAAEFQVDRVAQARGLASTQVRDLVKKTAQGPQLGFLGEARVNVLRLNLGLDEMKP